MDWSDLTTTPFQVSDALDPECRALLASASQRLDIPAARPSLEPADFEKVSSARSQALADALTLTWGLVERSSYDIQVLVVLMRLSVEVETIEGTIRALVLTRRILAECWNAREAQHNTQSDGDKARLNRKWAHYLDSVFEQIYGHFAREHEARLEAFSSEVRERGDVLRDACRSLDAILASRPTLRPAWWSRTLCFVLELAEGNAESGTTAAARVGPVGTLPGIPPEWDETAAPVSPADTTSIDTQSRAPENARVRSDSESSTPSSAELRVSHRYWQLQQSLSALAQLLKAGNYEKAGIIAQDLEETLQSFNVTAFFPALFAPLFELTAQYSEPLARSCDADPQRAAALRQLYRSDLDRFLEFVLKERD